MAESSAQPRKQSPKFQTHTDVLSETDDEDERMDCVHDIHTHNDGAEADVEEEEETEYYQV